MPKSKTRKSVAKRFRVTATGKVKRNHSGHAHLATKKARKRKRQLRQGAMAEPMDARKLKRMIGAA